MYFYEDVLRDSCKESFWNLSRSFPWVILRNFSRNFWNYFFFKLVLGFLHKFLLGFFQAFFGNFFQGLLFIPSWFFQKKFLQEYYQIFFSLKYVQNKSSRIFKKKILTNSSRNISWNSSKDFFRARNSRRIFTKIRRIFLKFH